MPCQHVGSQPSFTCNPLLTSSINVDLVNSEYQNKHDHFTSIRSIKNYCFKPDSSLSKTS